MEIFPLAFQRLGAYIHAMTKTQGPELTPEAREKMAALDIAARKAFAKSLGVSERTVRNWIAGKIRPMTVLTKRVERRLAGVGK